jgi:hypothetical protein
MPGWFARDSEALTYIQLGTETTDSLEDDADASLKEKLGDLHNIN